ncbi:peptidase family c78 protein [Besnoitia besnoiti]|uniref:Peptidase family c78 protein n=1 Tax=Besnoitia besnoiti TaxID=94643 RepID=A0A2A9MHM6_BESBE|nr:peptidase family c78 protein [Besnoitia besnoiti]PFH34920.1 peptidase family c78 protein [Besnoitia besnoiti]
MAGAESLPAVRIDWRFASFLRQLRSQLVLYGDALSTPFLAVLVGVPLPAPQSSSSPSPASSSAASCPSSLLLLSCFRLLRAERDPTVGRLFAAQGGAASPSLQEAIRSDLDTLFFVLPHGLRVLGLLGFSRADGATASAGAGSSPLARVAEAVAAQLHALEKESASHPALPSSQECASRLWLSCSLASQTAGDGGGCADCGEAREAVPWRFAFFANNARSSSAAGASLEEGACEAGVAVSVEDANAVLRSARFLFLRSRLALTAPLEAPVRVDVSAVLRKREEEADPQQRSDAVDAERDAAEGENSEAFVPELSAGVAASLVAALRSHEDVLLASPLSLFFCMPNGMYVHPSLGGAEGAAPRQASTRKGEAASGGGGGDAAREVDIWAAVSASSKAKALRAAEDASGDGGADKNGDAFSTQEALGLPWFRPFSRDATSSAALSAVPVPAFLSSAASAAASLPPSGVACCTYTAAEGKGEGVVVRSAELFLDACVLVPGAASLGSCADAFLVAFCRQLRRIGCELLARAGPRGGRRASSLTAAALEASRVAEAAAAPAVASLSLLALPVFPRLAFFARAADGCLALGLGLVKVAWLPHPLLAWNLEAAAVRRRWLALCGALRDSPAFRAAAALPWREAQGVGGDKIVNPHRTLADGPKWLAPARTVTSLVRGDAVYYHYCQDGERDEGWGCCYRSLQLVISWYRLQHFTQKPVPSIGDIQRLLKKFDMAHENLEIGSKTWIGTVEGSYILNWHLHVPCKMLHLGNASDLPSHAETLREHFDVVGSPVMMGVGDYAYTMLGIAFDAQSGEAAFLIADPHYPGDDGDLEKILDKGWVGWKKTSFFEKIAGSKFINLALPQICTEDGALFI